METVSSINVNPLQLIGGVTVKPGTVQGSEHPVVEANAPSVPSQLVNIALEAGITTLPVTQIPLTPSKRPRGRPKKDRNTPNSEKSSNNTPEKGTPQQSTPKKGRGRPRKIPITAGSNGAVLPNNKDAVKKVVEAPHVVCMYPPCDDLPIQQNSIDKLAMNLMKSGTVILPGESDTLLPGPVVMATSTPTESGKRKRGRPRKTPSLTQANSVASPMGNGGNVVKRGRGRPRKYPAKENTGEKRPVGRPKKRSLDNPTQQPTTPKKMKEGKYDTEEEEECIDLSRFLDVEGFVPGSTTGLGTAATESGTRETVVEKKEGVMCTKVDNSDLNPQQLKPLDSPKKRGPGRPRINKESRSGDSPGVKNGHGRQRKDSPQVCSKSEPSPPTSATKKRRGRPRKKPILADTAEEESSLSDVVVSHVPVRMQASNSLSKAAATSLLPPPPPPPPPPVLSASTSQDEPKTDIKPNPQEEGTSTDQPNDSNEMGKLQLEFSDSESDVSGILEVQRTAISALTDRVHPQTAPAQNTSPLLAENNFEESFDEDSDN